MQLILKACALVGTVVLGVGMAAAAPSESATELSPDVRPVLILQPPQGELMLVHHAIRMPDRQAESLALKLGYWIAAPIIRRDREERRARLPAAWLSAEPDRGFAQALLMQLSHGASNWPWRNLVISSSAAQSDSQLQTLAGQEAIVAAVRAELVDLGDKVEFHVLMDLDAVHGVASRHESGAHTQVEYFAGALLADTRQPRRSVVPFVVNGSLDEQVSTAARDLSQFLATIVARVSVPGSLRPHNPTLGELGAHSACGACRASDPVVYQQPGRVWVRPGLAPGNILALPWQPMRPSTSRTREFGSQAIP